MSGARITGAPEFIAVGENWRIVRSPGSPKHRGFESCFKRRRASKPRTGDAFLVLGDIEGAGNVRFEDLAEVTWAAEAVYVDDLAYRPVRWR